MRHERLAIVGAVLIGLVAQLLVLFANPPQADACSFAPPMLEVSPTDGLAPGDSMKVRGYGFIDLIFHPVEPEIDPVTGEELPQHSCAGIEVVDKEVTLTWMDAAGETSLMQVMGSEFEVELRVPDSATPGWAALAADWVVVDLAIDGPIIEPCPVHAADQPVRPAEPVRADCPWPCLELHVEAAARVAPPCPDPCIQLQVEDGGWVGPPCPDPCPLLGADGVVIHGCPDPCPVHLDADPANERWCPDPCGMGPHHDAVWCPPPCDLIHVRPAVEPHAWQDCPDPCLAGGAPDVLCPDPCLVGGAPDVLCPDPCVVIHHIDGVAEERCPDPCGWPAAGGDGAQDRPDAAIWCPDPCFDAEAIVCPVPLPAPVPVDCAASSEFDRCARRADPEPNPVPIDASATALPAVDPAPVAAAENHSATVSIDDISRRSIVAVRNLLSSLLWG